MNQYLLSTYAVNGEVPGSPQTRQEMQTFMERVLTLEAEMAASGAFVFGGGLQMQGSDAATAVHPNDDKVITQPGPYAESETQIAGFYIINAVSLEAAMNWAGKVAKATNHPIEVRPFRATGFLKDSMPGQSR
jgi:hypothetical protein